MNRLGMLAIVVLTMAAYVPAIDGDFIWDDDDYVSANTLLHDLDGLRRIWIPGETHQYYPAVFTTFWIEHQLWELDTLGYHVINVLLHAANALLLWRLLAVIGVPGAWMIGAVFALHPVHVESVAWITERKNVLSACLYLGSALAYLRFDAARGRAVADAGATGAGAAYTLALGLFVLALLSKSVTCSLPAALILVHVYRRDPLAARRLLPLLPFFALGLVAALHTAYLERESVGAEGAVFDRTFIERGLIASRALLFYAQRLVVPWPLMFVYPRWTIEAANVLAYVPLALVIAIGGAAVVALARGTRGPFVALAFFAGTVFPALGFVNVYPHQFSFVADHFQYLASIGVIAGLVGAAVHYGRPRVPRRAAAVVATLVLGALFLLTWGQAATYQSAETVWRDTLRKNDGAWLAHQNLSGILLRRAETGQALGREDVAATAAEAARRHAARAAELNPGYFIAHSNLSEALRLQGAYAEALTQQQTAIDIVRQRADDAGVERLPSYLAGNYAQLARLHGLLDQPAEAAAAYRTALDLGPATAEVRLALARTLVALERFDEAEAEYERVLTLDEESFAALGTLAALAERRGDHARADDWYRRAVAAATQPPERFQILPRFIRFLATCPDAAYRDPEEAIVLARGLVALSGGRSPATLDILASVCFEAGRTEEAIATAEDALARAIAAGDAATAAAIAQRLAEYRRARGETEPDT